MRRVLFVSLVILALVLAGCSSPAAPAATPAASSNAPGGGATPAGKPADAITITGNQGEKITVGSGLADEFKAFPVPGGFAFDSAGSMTAAGKDGAKLAAATWKGKVATAAVVAFYKKAATEQGWKEDMSFSDADGGQLWFTTKDGLSYIITYAGKDGAELELNVLASKESKPTPAAASPAATETKAAAAPPATPVASTPAPAATVAAPALADASALPAELKDLPIPGGFGVQKDGIARIASGGQFSMATAALWGTASPEKVVDFYQQALPAKGWQEEAAITNDDGADLAFMMEKDGGEWVLAISIAKEDGGTRVQVVLMVQ
ncbi:MAG: hypothetical protein ACYC4L_05495 [Chloroflexota bacterium]